MYFIIYKYVPLLIQLYLPVFSCNRCACIFDCRVLFIIIFYSHEHAFIIGRAPRDFVFRDALLASGVYGARDPVITEMNARLTSLGG